jgi:hypothetical protein
MRRIAVLIASAAINASTIPALAAERTPIKDIDASRVGWTVLQGQTDTVAENEKACRAYATSFYESVMKRQAAANRVEGERVLAALDSVVNAFNDLLATKCGS